MNSSRCFLFAAIVSVAGTVGCTPAARPSFGVAPSSVDSALVGRILLAEDRRDSADAALVDGEQSDDSRIVMLARRARARIRDPKFAEHDVFPPAYPPVTWPEPAWRLRYRALASAANDCSLLRAALADSAWPVRLRAADLAGPSCGADEALVSTLRAWVDALPPDASHRTTGNVSWHAAAHALVALARVRHAEARGRTQTLASHRQWQVRMYAARAAAFAGDTASLRTLAHDVDPNVRETALDALARSTRLDQALMIQALEDSAPQVVHAAATALKGNGSADVVRAANGAFARWVARRNASERDVRLALLDAAGRPASDDRPPLARTELPRRAVALALGADVRLRVVMSAGAFIVRLRGDAAPMMAARILSLARAGYYDGLSWHRVEPDFVIQGGSPGANEYVGLSAFLRDELGTVPHVRGTVGMSTRGHDTGDAQWFVNLRDNLRLNPDYTVFADVVQGMDVVDGVLEGDIIERIEEVPANVVH